METKKPKLKVEDLIPFNQETYKELLEQIDFLSALSDEYAEMEDLNDLHNLEIIKRKFNAHLQRFAVLFSRVKKFKDANFQYLGEHRKRFKAEAIEKLLAEGNNATNASNLVYSSEYYKERIALMEQLVEFFTKVDLLHSRYEVTLQAMIQSVSIAGKEKSNSNQ